MKVLSFVIGASALAAGLPAQAVSVVHQTAQGGYTTNVFGGSAWTTFTSMFDAAHTRSAVADFESLAGLSAYDAAWVDQELGNSLSATEIATLGAYIGSGHKAVLVGENYSWAGWNSSLMAVVGGTHVDTCDWSTGTPLVGGLLTSGIAAVRNICGSMIGSGGGETMLFTNGMAALYKIGAGEALVIMDSNWNDNSYGMSYDNHRFAENVITWLGTPVPEPATYALMAAGLGVVGMLARRRRPR